MVSVVCLSKLTNNLIEEISFIYLKHVATCYSVIMCTLRASGNVTVHKL